MRKAKIEKTHGDFSKFMVGIKKSLSKVMAEGGVFIINIDDSDVIYENLYDPDLKEFYSNTSFPSQILNLTQLGIKEVHQRVLAGTEHSGKALSPDFKVGLFFSVFNFRGVGLEQNENSTRTGFEPDQGQDREKV
jgi:hypothetical protein